MNADSILAVLDCLGVDRKSVQVGDEWIQGSCPLATWRHEGGSDTRPSWGVEIASGHGHCFSCGWSGTLIDLIYDLRQRSGSDRRWGRALDLVEEVPDRPVKQHKRKLVRFPERMLEALPPAYWRVRGKDVVHPYLTHRGVPAALARRLDLRFDATRGRVCFPVRTADGVLRGIHGRTVYDGDPLTYLMYDHAGSTNAHVWYGEEWVTLDKPILLVESVFDYTRAVLAYPNTLAALTASVSRDKALRLGGARELWLLFDRDVAGDDARLRLARYLPWVQQGQLYVPRVWVKASRRWAKDPGEMSVPRIIQLLRGTLL